MKAAICIAICAMYRPITSHFIVQTEAGFLTKVNIHIPPHILMNFLLINGSNLNVLSIRKLQIYGYETLQDMEQAMET